ncbi:hypothetical protein C2U70_31190 [Bradyrhizobium guangdongense]|nr:hypothetical protein C2U70_31190 [Bradyrhizobium guangdongense]
MVMLPKIQTQRWGRSLSGRFLFLLSSSAPQTGTGKSPSESAQKTTAICANQEIFGFDWGDAAERTTILRAVVDGGFTMWERQNAAQE